MKMRRWAVAIGVALVWVVASEGSAVAAPATTTAPTQTTVGTDRYLVPKGTYTGLPAGTTAWTVEYDWGIVDPGTGIDGPGQENISTIPLPAAGNWQGANVGPAQVGV